MYVTSSILHTILKAMHAGGGFRSGTEIMITVTAVWKDQDMCCISVSFCLSFFTESVQCYQNAIGIYTDMVSFLTGLISRLPFSCTAVAWKWDCYSNTSTLAAFSSSPPVSLAMSWSANTEGELAISSLFLSPGGQSECSIRSPPAWMRVIAAVMHWSVFHRTMYGPFPLHCDD